MGTLTAWKNRFLARGLRYCPWLVRRWARRQIFASSSDMSWTPLRKRLSTCRVALVTTAGVHLRTQVPFDMQDPLGDPSFREIPATVTPELLTITHDYYDHRDADRDVNIVFPIERLRELAAQSEIGEVAPIHLGFMGHVDGELVPILRQQTAPAAAALLAEHQVDAVLLFPA
jgi:D-proline reductase (dithiol) PrdB